MLEVSFKSFKFFYCYTFIISIILCNVNLAWISIILKSYARYRGGAQSDSGSDGENGPKPKRDVIDIETVKPPDIQGTW